MDSHFPEIVLVLGIKADQLEQEVEREGEHSGTPAGRERK